jgi:uncharacterized membrane protein YfcA
MPDLNWLQWTTGALCAFFTGVAKTGVPGLGVMVVPLMVLTVGDARLAAGWLLPILCTADLFAVYYWRKHAAAGRLFSLAPWVLAGLGLGALALALPERALRPMVGAIVLVMLGVYLYRKGHPSPPAAHPVPYGIAAGFSTTVANAAGPVMSLYLLSKRLPKEEFIATGAWFFFLINLAKVPVYVYHGLFSQRSLMFNLLLAPAVLAGALTGRWLFDRIPQTLFDRLVLALTAVSALLLFR